MKIEEDNKIINLEIIQEYFKDFDTESWGNKHMSDDGWNLKVKGVGDIGSATAYENGIKIRITNKDYLNKIKDICKKIENEEDTKPKIIIVIVNTLKDYYEDY